MIGVGGLRAVGAGWGARWGAGGTLALGSGPSAASQPALGRVGANVPKVLPRSTLELKVRGIW